MERQKERSIMSTSFDRRVNDNPSTYFVQDRKNQKEFTRLTVQDRLMTAMMGGVLPEQPDPRIFHRVLDVACGTGGWAIEAAQTYPEMSLVGIDISQRMVKYASTQAKTCQVNDRVKFRVMDALHPLDFPAAYFDLINMRLSASYVRTWDWPKLLIELLRVTRPGGVVRVTESEIMALSNSPALTRFFEAFQCALYRAGHLFTQESTGLIDHLPRLLDLCGYQQVQTKTHIVEYRAGTPAGEAFYEAAMLLMQTLCPFIQKWSNIGSDYDVMYQQALEEMRRPNFHATWNIFTAWGSKPKSKS
jgi:ubiquinone/menaquinone biosynthesis C-methylase UbiE